MRVAAALVSISLLLACSSSGSNETASNDAGKDGASLDGATDGSSSDTPPPEDTAPAHTACGAPPYATFHLKAGEMHEAGSTNVLPGATLTFDTCPGVSITADASGEAFASLQRGVPFTATVSATNHISVMSAEYEVGADETSVEIQFLAVLPLSTADNVILAYDPTKPSFALVIDPDPTAKTDKCRVTEGVLVQAPGGTVHYMGTAWPPDTSEAVPLSPFSLGPVVFVTGLSGTSESGVEAKESDGVCSVEIAGPHFHQTGRFALAPGVWTVANLWMTDL